jgi:hypothetical protein
MAPRDASWRQYFLWWPPCLWQLLFDVERGGRMERLTTDIDLE